MRQIAFRDAEIFSAIKDYRSRRGEPLPVGSVVGIDVEDAPDVTATIRIAQDGGRAVIRVELSAESIAAALILFCIKRKIPLPAHADKSIRKSGDTIVLLINISLEYYAMRQYGSKARPLPGLRDPAPRDRRKLN
jgi:hypothetical protein